MTEPAAALILVVTDQFSQAERLRGILTAEQYRVLVVADLATAGMRIAGGGVDLVVMRLSPDPGKPPAWKSIASLQESAPELPVLVLCDGESKDLIIPASISGIVEVVPEALLVSTVHRLIERQPSLPEQSERTGAGGIISVQGAKGGVGASTVALNLAAVLARHGKTILVEMRPGLGTLASRFGLRRKVRTIADLAARSARAILTADVEECLWPCHEISGLRILFGPGSLECDFDWKARAGQILRAAAGAANYVVVDLPHCFSSVNRAALRVTDYFLLVLERDALCLQAGKLMLGAMESENLLPQLTAAVVVSRVSLAAPVEVSVVEHDLNVPVLGSVPPDPDLCLRAYQAHTAVVALDPEGLLTDSYARLAEAIPASFR